MVTKKKVVKKAKKGKKLEQVPQEQTPNYFIHVLAIVSILGFVTIIFQSWFEFDLSLYIEALILLALGLGFILESEPKILFDRNVTFDKRNFSRLTTFTIGAIAAIAGFLSFPFINVQHFVFIAIKGVIAFIAIVFIAAETWLIKDDGKIN